MAALSVYLYGMRIGKIDIPDVPAVPGRNARTARRAKARFSYDPEIVERYEGRPLLSVALPVREEPYSTLETENWFSNLLPEEERLDAAKRYFGIDDAGNSDDRYRILGEIAWDCAGAVSVVPEGSALQAGMDEVAPRTEPISPGTLAKMLGVLPDCGTPRETVTANTAKMRTAVAGCQDKLCIATTAPPEAEDGYIVSILPALSYNGYPTTLILKPDNKLYPGLAESEAWAMTAASYATPTADAALLRLEDLGVDMDSAPILAVSRYDRAPIGSGCGGDSDGNRNITGDTVAADAQFARIHQEDLAQALLIPPSEKYASGKNPKAGDPSYRKLASILDMHGASPEEAKEQLFGQMIANFALGNSDNHSKNISILHNLESRVELAPLYDATPTIDYLPSQVKMGMRINGKIRIDRITRSDMLEEAVGFGLREKQAERVLDDALERLETGIRAASDLYPDAARMHFSAADKRIGVAARAEDRIYGGYRPNDAERNLDTEYEEQIANALADLGNSSAAVRAKALVELQEAAMQHYPDLYRMNRRFALDEEYTGAEWPPRIKVDGELREQYGREMQGKMVFPSVEEAAAWAQGYGQDIACGKVPKRPEMKDPGIGTRIETAGKMMRDRSI